MRESWGIFVKNNRKKLRQMGIELKGMNSIKFVSKEPLKHRLGKLLVCHNLFKAGHRFKTEQMINKNQCDVIDLKTFGIYEIESYATPRIIKKKIDDFNHPYIEDLVIIDLKKIQSDWYEIVKLSDQMKRLCNLP